MAETTSTTPDHAWMTLPNIEAALTWWRRVNPTLDDPYPLALALNRLDGPPWVRHVSEMLTSILDHDTEPDLFTATPRYSSPFPRIEPLLQERVRWLLCWAYAQKAILKQKKNFARMRAA